MNTAQRIGIALALLVIGAYVGHLFTAWTCRIPIVYQIGARIGGNERAK